MEGGSKHTRLSPTVMHVIEQCVAAIRADAEIPDDAADRLEKLLGKGTVPKPDDINVAVFGPGPDGKA